MHEPHAPIATDDRFRKPYEDPTLISSFGELEWELVEAGVLRAQIGEKRRIGGLKGNGACAHAVEAFNLIAQIEFLRQGLV